MTFSSRISDSEYVNWLKVGFGLKYLKEGLNNFVEHESKAFHKDVLASVFGNTTHICQLCSPQNIKEDRKNRSWKIPCPNNVCDKIMKKIVERHTTGRNIPWFNCGEKLDWSVNYWSVSKLFMNPGQSKKQSPIECDCGNIMNLFINCKWFHLRLMCIFAEKVLKHRNEMMHSATMKVKAEDMKSWLTHMADLLKSVSDYNNRPEVKTAVDLIEKMRDTNIEITISDELKLLHDVQIGLQQKVEEQCDGMQELKKNQKELKEEIKTELQKDREEHGEKMGEQDMNIQQLQGTVEKLEHCLVSKKSTDEAAEVQIQEQKEEIRTLSATAAEMRDKSKDHSEKIQALETEMKSLNTNEVEMKKKLMETLDNMKTIQERLNRLQASVQEHDKMKVDLDKLKATVIEMKDDISVEQNTQLKQVLSSLESQIENAVPKAMSLKAICEATLEDDELQTVMKSVSTGKQVPGTSARVQHQLTVVSVSSGQVLLFENRLVIPKKLQHEVVKLAHEGHQGIVKTKQLLREKVCFPGINKPVEEICRSCIPCLASTPKQVSEPLKMTDMPEEPWTHLSLDFCGPFPSGKYLMVLIDDHSRYPVVEMLSSVSSKSVIPLLDKVLAQFGIPEVFKTDNGPPFNGNDFAQFAEYMGLKHRKVTPLWPQANGECERFMRTIGKSIRAAHADIVVGNKNCTRS